MVQICGVSCGYRQQAMKALQEVKRSFDKETLCEKILTGAALVTTIGLAALTTVAFVKSDSYPTEAKATFTVMTFLAGVTTYAAHTAWKTRRVEREKKVDDNWLEARKLPSDSDEVLLEKIQISGSYYGSREEATIALEKLKRKLGRKTFFEKAGDAVSLVATAGFATLAAMAFVKSDSYTEAKVSFIVATFLVGVVTCAVHAARKSRQVVRESAIQRGLAQIRNLPHIVSVAAYASA